MNLQQFLRILRARWLLMTITMAIIVGLAIGVSLMLPQRYTATASVVIDMKGIDPVTGMVLPVVIPASGYIATQIDILSSHKVALKAVDTLRLLENPAALQLFQERAQGRGSARDWFANLLLDDLKVEPSRESSM
jgi:polysaccharide biosynthesis transport protein